MVVRRTVVALALDVGEEEEGVLGVAVGMGTFGSLLGALEDGGSLSLSAVTVA